jgi:NADP-dependent 3-hydroxy acid dehydrogenase YdfG
LSNAKINQRVLINLMKKTIFITGATSGIGEASAIKFAAAGFRLILTGRRADRLSNLSSRLKTLYQSDVLQLVFDVQNRKQVNEAIDSMNDEWKQVDILLNNAGLALGREPFNQASVDDWDTMLHTNVNGLLYVSRAVLPLIEKSNSPQIINIGSIAGKEVYADGNVYCASKFAVDAITKAMRIDLLKKGIKVTVIHPGAVETEFSVVRFKGDVKKASAAYIGFQPLHAADVADAIFYVAGLPDHVCINELVIMPKQQASSSYFDKK